MHSWKNPVHEELVRKIAIDEGLKYVSASYQLSGLIKYLQRMQTTEVNAYLSPIIDRYISEISRKVLGHHFWVMTSAGGLVKASNFMPKDSLLSGPAGGVVGAVAMAKAAGYNKIISFDMGGTSTDVSRYDKEHEYCFEIKIGSANIHSPALNIETVAAGGGSICSFDGYKLVVGPESAGAMPGPACYGAGGMHACSIACLLNIKKILIPENAGLLSANGIGEAVIERFAEKQVLQVLDASLDINDLLPDLEEEVLNKLRDEGVELSNAEIRSRMVFMRFVGQESTIEVPWISIEQLISDFRSAYLSVYGHWSDERAIEVESVRVVASEKMTYKSKIRRKEQFERAADTNKILEGYPVFLREQLLDNQIITGPCIIADSYSTSFVEEGWTSRMNEQRTMVLSREKMVGAIRQESLSEEAELELFSRRFMSIAENMGAMLQRTSLSG